MATNLTNAEHSLDTNVVRQGAEAAESGLFTNILGSNINAKWFDSLMQHAGNYLFIGALFLFTVKFFINVVQYVKSANKNIDEKAALGWSALQTALIGTAIVGALVAATAFALATPILFVTAMAADTFRNLGLLVWNMGSLTALWWQVRNKLNDPLTALKYEALKEKYWAKIKAHGIASFIGLTLTAAVGIIFLFPQIGLTIGTTAIAIAGVKLTTVAGLAGTLAGAVLTISTIPAAISASKWCFAKAKQGFNFLFRKKMDAQGSLLLNETEEQVAARKEIQLRALIPTKKDPNFKITNENEIEKAIDHTIDFDTGTKRSRFRETIIDHIEDQELAIKALNKMLTEKITQLTSEIDVSRHGSFNYFSERQLPKRLQKLNALLLLKLQLNPESGKEEVFGAYKKYFKNSWYHESKFDSMDCMISFIEKTFPGIKQSFFLDQSDTQNILQAFKVYDMKPWQQSAPIPSK